MTITLGLDIGTFESKGVLVEDGRVLALATAPHEMLVPRPGWAEHRPEEDWWADTVTIIGKLLATPGIAPTDIKAVALSAIGPCLVPTGSDGRALMNAILYGVDNRAATEVNEMTREIGEDRILATSGNALTSQAVGPKILWLKRHRPEIFAAAETLGTSTTWLVQRMTGARVIDHYTAANFAPLYDIAAQDWTTDLVPDLVDPARLPRLLWSTEIAGEVTPDAAEATGLAPGTPVTCGTIDAAAEAVSVGLRGTGDMMMMYGSTIFLITLTPDRLIDGRLWSAPWLFPGQHASMAGLATSGTLTHWFRDQFAREVPREDAFPTLAAEAHASPPGAKGLLMLPYFSGERTPIHDPNAKGTFFGLNLTHTRGDLYRALIEGIAYGTRHVTDTYAELGAPPARLLAVGGGTKNRLWLQATSDISGLDQIVAEITTGAGFGNAFLAALAIGAAKADDIDTWNPAAETIAAERHPAYEAAYPLFRSLYTATRDIAHALDRHEHD
ncbi:MAG: FGGY-family carbohydrate kinase [Pseudomonadota bacterium]